MKQKHIVITASTFPASDTDAAPAFVKEQVIALKKHTPDVRYSVLVPHNSHAKTQAYTDQGAFEERRYHYFWPFRWELLTGRGIVASLQQNKFLYLQVPFFILFQTIALFRFVRKERPDLIYAHWFMPQAITAAVVSKLTGTPYVFTSHSSDMQIMKKIPFSKPLMNFAMRRAKKWTVVSDKTLAKTKPLFSDDEWQRYSQNLQVIPMGVDIKDYAKTRSQTISPTNHKLEQIVKPDKAIIFFIGRLSEIKGVDLLVKAFASLDRTDCELIIAGDGQERQNLESLASKLGVSESIHFVGYVTDKDKMYLFSKADFMVVPSIKDSRGHTEGFPVVLMEGLAAGKIIIASDVSGGELVINDGANGYLFSSGSVESLAGKLRESLDVSAGQKKKMSATAQKDSLEYDWAVIAKKHYEFLLHDV